jgi:hypothetical protein
MPGLFAVPVTAWRLERVQEKWKPVFRPDARLNKNLERDDDSKISHPTLALPEKTTD